MASFASPQPVRRHWSRRPSPARGRGAAGRHPDARRKCVPAPSRKAPVLRAAPAGERFHLLREEAGGLNLAGPDDVAIGWVLQSLVAR